MLLSHLKLCCIRTSTKMLKSKFGLSSLLPIQRKERSFCLQAHRQRHGHDTANTTNNSKSVRHQRVREFSGGNVKSTNLSNAKGRAQRAQSRADASSASLSAATTTEEVGNIFFPPPPPRPSEHQPGMCDTEVWAGLSDDRRRIFCNR